MKPSKAFRLAFVVLLLAGLAVIAVPAASVASGLRMSTGKPTSLGYGIVALPMNISNKGFLGIDGILLHVKIVRGENMVLFSGTVGPIAAPPGSVIPFEVAFVNQTANPLLGNISAVVSGVADVGGFIPVDINVTAGGTSSATGAPSYGFEGAGTLWLFAAVAAAKGAMPAGDRGGRADGRGRRWNSAGAWRGGAIGAVYLVVLVIGPRYAGSTFGGFASQATGQGSGVQSASSVADFVFGPGYLAMVLALASVQVALNAAEGPAMKGALKAVEGSLLGLCFFLLFGGGSVLIRFAAGSVAATLSVALGAALLLLELASASRIMQGMAEYREGRGVE